MCKGYHPCSGHSLTRTRTIVSDLEVLIFIPTTSHSTVDRSIKCLRLQFEEANKKKRCNTEAAKPDTLNASAVPRSSVCKGYEQSRWQSTDCQQCGINSDTGGTGTVQPVWGGSLPHTPKATPTELPDGRTPPSSQNTCRVVKRTPMHPQGPAEGLDMVH